MSREERHRWMIAGWRAAASTLALVLGWALATPSRAENLVPCTDAAVQDIAYGDTVSCEIARIGDQNVFRFRGGVDEVLYVEAVRISGDIDPCLQLIRPDQTEVFACNAQALNSIDERLSQPGFYVLAVTARNTGGVPHLGRYNLALQRLLPASPDRRALVYGDNISDIIDPKADVDTFAFVGSAGDRITIQGARLGADIDPCITLVSPDNTRASACNASPVNRLDTTLTQPGIYTVLLRARGTGGFPHSGEYSLNLECLQGPCIPQPPPPPPPGLCVPSSTTLCMLEGRFSATLLWSDGGPEGLRSAFVAVPKTDSPGASSGIFYFYEEDPNNWEVLVKMLDGCGPNNRFWVLVSASTGYQWELEVRDEVAEITKTFRHPLDGNASGISDFEAFGTCDD